MFDAIVFTRSFSLLCGGGGVGVPAARAYSNIDRTYTQLALVIVVMVDSGDSNG